MLNVGVMLTDPNFVNFKHCKHSACSVDRQHLAKAVRACLLCQRQVALGQKH